MAALPVAEPSVVEVDPLVDGRWDRFVSEHPHGLVYHHSAWLEALAREYAQPLVGLACVDADGSLRGVLPLIRTRGLPFRRTGGHSTGARLSSLPRTPVAGPLALDSAATISLVSAALERARREPGVQLQLKPLDARLDGLVDGLAAAPWRVDYVHELPPQSGDLRFGDSRNHGAVKRAVNKAARAGVEVRVADSEEDLRAWYRLYLDTMRSNIVPPRSFRFFAALREHLQPNGLMRLLVAEQIRGGRRRMLAGSMYLMLGETVFFGFNGRRRDALDLRPNDALMWQAIHDAWQEGYRRFDLGEVPAAHGSLADFKRKWSTDAVQLTRYYCPPVAAADEAPPGRASQVAAAAWRRLPLKATELVGDRLYAYL